MNEVSIIINGGMSDLYLSIFIIVFGIIVYIGLSRDSDSKGFGSCMGLFALIVCVFWALFNLIM